MATDSDREPGLVAAYPVEAAVLGIVVILAIVSTVPGVMGTGWAPQPAENFTTFQIIFSLLEVVGLTLVASVLLLAVALGWVREAHRSITLTLGLLIIAGIAVAGVLLLLSLLSNAGVPPLVRVGGIALILALVGMVLLSLPGWYEGSSGSGG